MQVLIKQYKLLITIEFREIVPRGTLNIQHPLSLANVILLHK